MADYGGLRADNERMNEAESKYLAGVFCLHVLGIALP